jgi:hypothetical protein
MIKVGKWKPFDLKNSFEALKSEDIACGCDQTDCHSEAAPSSGITIAMSAPSGTCFQSGRSGKPLRDEVEQPARDPPSLARRPTFHQEENRDAGIKEEKPSLPTVVGSAPRWLVGSDDGSHAETPLATGFEPGTIDGVFFDGQDDNDENDEAVYAAGETVEVWVAMDSGSVDHVAGPNDLPRDATVRPAEGVRAGRNYTAANGTAMANYGEVDVVMEDDDGNEANGSYAVTDATRLLHSTSRICDNDCSVLFTKGECKVFKGEIKVANRQPLATYHRKGGLYLRRIKMRAGRKKVAGKTAADVQQVRQSQARQSRPIAPKAAATGFTRPGMKR